MLTVVLTIPVCLSSQWSLSRAYILNLTKEGIRQRLITEINEDNLPYAKEVMKFCQIRHLDRVAGNFGIADRREIRMHAVVRESRVPTQLLISNARSFVEQHQYFFDELWKKAILQKRG